MFCIVDKEKGFTEPDCYNGDPGAVVSGNHYYYNTFIRNYAYIATGYFDVDDYNDKTWYGPDRFGNDKGGIKSSIRDIDKNATVYWYSDLIS
jgi:hypothetical protein